MFSIKNLSRAYLNAQVADQLDAEIAFWEIRRNTSETMTVLS